MLGRKVKHMPMGRIAQERPARHTATQGLGEVRDVTTLGHDLSDRQAPMGIEIVDHLIVTLHRGELLHDMSHMGGPVCTGTSVAEIPEKLACGDDKRGQQGAYTMANILVLALFWFPWLHRLGGVGTLENLHPRFFVGTDDEAPLLKETERMHIELTDIVCLGLEVGIVTVEPV